MRFINTCACPGKVYDSTMEPDKYQAPLGLVRHLNKAQLLAGRETTAVLDVGCGTGLLGKAVVELLTGAGEVTLDGMDNSQGMLEQAAKKGFYGRLFQGTLGEALDCETGVYDAAVSSGVFTPGHAPASGLVEVARMVKVGGIICYTLKLDLYEASDYPALHKKLVDEGVWEDAGHSEPYAALPGDQGSKDCMLCAFTWRVKSNPAKPAA